MIFCLTFFQPDQLFLSAMYLPVITFCLIMGSLELELERTSGNF